MAKTIIADVNIYQGVVKFVSGNKKSAIIKQYIFGTSGNAYNIVFIKADFSAYSKGNTIKYQYANDASCKNDIVFVA